MSINPLQLIASATAMAKQVNQSKEVSLGDPDLAMLKHMAADYDGSVSTRRKRVSRIIPKEYPGKRRKRREKTKAQKLARRKSRK